MYFIYFLTYCLVTPSFAFIIGGCIGPKSVLERYLNPTQKAQLRELVHTMFDGNNAEQVVTTANTYVHNVISQQQWQSILPELRNYQALRRECSIYAQLLPSDMYKQLLNSVYKATQLGAADQDLKRLVEDYVDRAIRSGLIGQNKPSGNPTNQRKPSFKPRIRYYPQRIINENVLVTKPPFPRVYPFFTTDAPLLTNNFQIYERRGPQVG
ncbi:hypothetical protein RB195_020426 [Necator americanus]|uniref:SXP/RAL-2 family protein Ani s 5-like cation-binding domain-containing protein n=1 Tax=Necator americanus TaxID=51031 RepID=A0ABR1CIT5_NECAM